ncbi:DUF6608 family protein [Pseudobutyrivibrio xylanivorans]
MWVSQFIEPLAKSAYHDIFVNYTGLFLIVAIIAIVGGKIKQVKQK